MVNRIKTSRNIPKPTHFGKNLKFLRRLNGMSQAQLAQQIGLTRNNIASYESGIVEPNIQKFIATCSIFNVNPRSMLDEVMVEKPLEIKVDKKEADPIMDKYLLDQLDDFVNQTNEMTKIYEGYQAFLEMRKEMGNYEENKILFSTLIDLLDLLQSLIQANWEVIQIVYPTDIKSSQ